ncbi:hypothetical protein PCASD_22317 [Puccinia coronata f. sp. avenae]|uniref:UME domain-containing protein n=1 Tax=Puccinia coronata f. sp. avenae TaxID=200324 RepID=A0A2N5TW24_9BASI|nr:hypothetical protein PCASD_22317 [Puccinia coronata f. sp. avenae]
MILLLLKSLRWLADENGHMTMPTTNESITRLVVQHGKSMIEDLLSNSKAALNSASPNLQMMSLALLSCPMDTHYGQARYAYAPQETYAKYQLLDYASIHWFDSLLAAFTPKWTQQISAQEYCPELGRFLHWLVHSLEAIHQRLTTARTNPSMRIRKRTDPGDIDHSGPSSCNNNETNATPNNLSTRSEHQIPENQISSPTNLHYNLISLLASCSALGEVPSDLGKNNLAPILLKSLERINSLVSHRAEECEPRIRMYQSVQRGFDLLGSLICNSALEPPGFLNSAKSDNLLYLPTGDLRNIFQCSSCDRCHLDPPKVQPSESKFLHRCILTSAIMLCHNLDLLSYLNQKNDKLDQKGKSIQLAQSGARLAFIRFLTRVLNHTEIADIKSIEESLIVCTSEVNQKIAFILERGNRKARIVAGRMLAGVFSSLLHVLLVWPTGQLSDFQLEPFLNQLASLAKGGSLKFQETLTITIVHCFELTRIMDAELLDQGRIELNNSPGYQICPMLIRQMCRRGSYFLGVIRSELAFFSRWIGVSIYSSLDRYLSSLSQFMLIDLKFDTYASTLFADLHEVSTETFFNSTSRYTLPLLVLKSQSTPIEAIAKAKEETVLKLLVGGANPDQMAIQISKLMDISAGSINYRLIVKVGSECDQSQGPERVKAALRKALQLKKSLADWKEIPSDKEIREELTNNILPILSYMNGSLQDLRGKITMSEKIQVMHGLGNLIYLVDSGVSSYSPLIMASLQASLVILVLRSATLQTWDIFVSVTPLNNLMPFIAQISAAIVTVWPQLTVDQKHVSISILKHILQYGEKLGHYAFDIADLSGLSFSHVPPPGFLPVCTGESEIVIRQSLKEFSIPLKKNHQKMKMLMAGDTFHPLVGDVVKALIGVKARCNDTSDEIKSIAFECLGTVGAVDPK